MEDLTIVLLILGLFLPSFFGVIWYVNRLNPSKNQPKRATQAADTSVSELYAVQTEQIKDIVKLKNNEIKSLQSKLRLDQEIEQETPDSKDNQVQFEDIKALVTRGYPQYAKLLDLPGAKQWIKKQTKDMSLDEVISMVEGWTGKKINKSTGSEPNSQTVQNQPGYF